MEDNPILEDLLGPEKGASLPTAAAAAADGTQTSKKPIVMLVIGMSLYFFPSMLH